MRSFEHGYLLEQPISQNLLMMVRALGEFRGRQNLYQEQSPEILETLKRVAVVQSVESSNRIEGITVAADRLEAIVTKKTRPKGRSEEEVAGYRDVLAEIHANAKRMTLNPKLILEFHRQMYAHTSEKGGRWKEKDNAILEILPDGRQVVRFRPVSALAAPEFMKELCSLYHRAVDDRQAEPLLLIASFVFDFECIHPFWDGNGRIGRLLTLLLLYQAGYEVGRYIGLERIVEESKETYYEVLLKSSQEWHEAKHDLRPWWNYFLGTLIAAYREFEERVGTVTTARGAKREMVQQTIKRLPSRFRFGELQRACPGVSYPTLKRALMDLKQQKKVRCLGKGRDAEWERIGSWID
ncbi:MAG TPA: Fic family protein [bacterium]|nr:Fic family protein [bacterium]